MRMCWRRLTDLSVWTVWTVWRFFAVECSIEFDSLEFLDHLVVLTNWRVFTDLAKCTK